MSSPSGANRPQEYENTHTYKHTAVQMLENMDILKVTSVNMMDHLVPCSWVDEHLPKQEVC